jgi:hypothetical protein
MESFTIDMQDEKQRKYFIACQLKSRLKMEMVGLKCHGKSAYSQAKSIFNLNGNRQKVLDQLQNIVDDMQK